MCRFVVAFIATRILLAKSKYATFSEKDNSDKKNTDNKNGLHSHRIKAVFILTVEGSEEVFGFRSSLSLHELSFSFVHWYYGC